MNKSEDDLYNWAISYGGRIEEALKLIRSGRAILREIDNWRITMSFNLAEDHFIRKNHYNAMSTVENAASRAARECAENMIRRGFRRLRDARKGIKP